MRSTAMLASLVPIQNVSFSAGKLVHLEGASSTRWRLARGNSASAMQIMLDFGNHCPPLEEGDKHGHQGNRNSNSSSSNGNNNS
mmetsp:Transcript_12717/g.35168  ORF Transcript_12717/g.35168 Transcript_12717/m.35168 type:complete len:84 (+) Transcript_12717:1433-1684(+)